MAYIRKEILSARSCILISFTEKWPITNEECSVFTCRRKTENGNQKNYMLNEKVSESINERKNI